MRKKGGGKIDGRGGRRKIKIIVRVYNIIIDLQATDLRSGETNGEKLG